jgi:hypothetical protein
MNQCIDRSIRNQWREREVLLCCWWVVVGWVDAPRDDRPGQRARELQRHRRPFLCCRRRRRSGTAVAWGQGQHERRRAPAAAAANRHACFGVLLVCVCVDGWEDGMVVR